MVDVNNNFRPVAIVVGSTGGIGTPLSKKLIENGYDIAFIVLLK